MLRAQSTLLCEYARAGQNGSFDFLGVFDRIASPSVPAQHRSLAFVVQLICENEDGLGKREATIQCLRPGGVPLLEQKVRMNIRADGGTWLGAAKVVFNVQGLPIPEYGRYEFRLSVDGSVVATHPFAVVASAQPSK